MIKSNISTETISRICELYLQNKSMLYISKLENLSDSTIYNILKRNNIDTKIKNKTSTAIEQEIIALYIINTPVKDIVKLKNIARKTIYIILKRNNITEKNKQNKPIINKIIETNRICLKCSSTLEYIKKQYVCKLCKKEYMKIFYEKNKEKEKSQEAKDKIKIYKKQYNANNREKTKQWSEKYRNENRLDINKKANLRDRNLRIQDPVFKLKENISASVRQSLKSNNSSKDGGSILNYLLYTIEELKFYIEFLFHHQDNLTPDGKIWMTWENQGNYRKSEWDDKDPSTWKWQLDHIEPHSNFKYTDMKCQEFKDCWALSNLRPYSAKQNVLDGMHRVRHK